MKLQLIQRIELCVSDVLFEIEGTAEGIRYGVNFEVAIPEDFLDPKLKLLFVQDYTTNLERANSTLSLSIWLGS